jgi:outer membrane lipoprotein-sorting protein
VTHWKPKLVFIAATILFVTVSSKADPESQPGRLSPQDVLTRMQAAYAVLLSYSDEVKAEGSQTYSDGKVVTSHGTATVKLSRPILYRIEWRLKYALPSKPDEDKTVAFWSQGNGAYITAGKGITSREKDRRPFPFVEGDMTYVPSAFYGEVNPNSPLSRDCCSGEKYVFGADEKVEDVECYVLLSVPIPLEKGQMRRQEISTLWIGKSDYLLRQIRIVGPTGSSTLTRSNIVINAPMSREEFGSSGPT